MATHSSVLAWRIPGTGEPGGLPPTGSHKVGHDWSDLAAAAAGLPRWRYWSIIHLPIQETWDTGSISGSGRCPGEGRGNPLRYSCLKNPKNRGSWQVTVHMVAKSQTWLKWLSTAHLRMHVCIHPPIIHRSLTIICLSLISLCIYVSKLLSSS